MCQPGCRQVIISATGSVHLESTLLFDRFTVDSDCLFRSTFGRKLCSADKSSGFQCRSELWLRCNLYDRRCEFFGVAGLKKESSVCDHFGQTCCCRSDNRTATRHSLNNRKSKAL